MPEIKNRFAMLHGAATDKLPLLCGVRGKLDPFTRTMTVEGEGIELSGIAEPFRTSTHKLLCAAAIAFTAVNHIGTERRINTRSISISLRDYASMLGMPATDTTLKNLRKILRRDLALLGSARLSWTETVQGETHSHSNVGLAESCGIRLGVVEVTLSQQFADWLVGRPLMQYPQALFGLDERSAVAYRLGYKLALHTSNRNNILRGTAGTVKTATLLRCSGLPAIGELRAKEQSYTHRIVKPFRAALDTLVRSGVLAEYTFRSADSVHSFADWLGGCIDFGLAGTEKA